MRGKAALWLFKEFNVTHKLRYIFHHNGDTKVDIAAFCSYSLLSKAPFCQ